MKTWGLLFIAGLLTAIVPDTVSAADNASVAFGKAITAWRNGELQVAKSLLSQLADGGSSDPRVWYFRGVLAEQTGDSGDADFRKAAAIEARTYATADMNRALESIQGALRIKIERIRADARIAARPEQKRSAHREWYRRGLTAMQAGRTAQADQFLTKAIDDGTNDPRPYFMRAVLKYRAGRIDDAAEDIRQGMQRETDSRSMAAVDEALVNVQGNIRFWLEKEIAVSEDGQSVTRGERRRSIMAEEWKREQQLLAASGDERQQMLQAAAEQAERELAAAAEKIRLADEARAAALAAGTAEPSVTVTPPTVTPPRTTVPSVASSTQAIDVSWLAPDNEVVLYVRVKDFVNSQFMKPLMDMPEAQAGMQMMLAESGFQPTDIDTVTVGLGNMAALMFQAGSQAQAGPQNPDAVLKSLLVNGALVVVRTNRPLDYDRLVQASGAQQMSHGTATYYQLPGDASGDPPPAAFVVDAQTYLFGAEHGVKAAIDRGPGQAVNPLLGFVPGNAGFAVAVASPNLPAMTAMIPQDPSAPPFAQQLTNAIKGNLNGVALTLTAADDLKIAVRLKLSDPAAGSEAVAAMTMAGAQLSQMYQGAKGMVPAPLHPVTDAIVSSVAAEYQDPVAVWSVALPDNFIPTIQENQEALMGPIMMAMMAGGAAGAGGGPGGLNFGGGGNAEMPGEFGGGPASSPPAATAVVGDVSISATATVGKTTIFNDQNEPEEKDQVKLNLNLISPEAAKAGAVGFVKLDSATDQAGGALVQQTDGFGDLSDSFQEVDRSDESFGPPQPDGGVLVTIPLSVAGQPPTQIAAATGSVMLKVVDSSVQVVIDNFATFDGREIQSPELAATGYGLQLALEEGTGFDNQPTTSVQLTLLKTPDGVDRNAIVDDMMDGGGLGVQLPELLDANGNVLENNGFSRGGGGGEITMGIDVEGKIQPGTQLRLTINTGARTVSVPFEVNAVAVTPDNGFGF